MRYWRIVLCKISIFCLLLIHFDPLSSSDKLTLELTGLQTLANGYHYEGWAIVDGNPVSTGKFNIGTTGALVDLEGKIIPNGEFQVEADLSTASAIVLTIEPAGDMDTLPADTHYLAGDVQNGSAALHIGHAAALGNDFTSDSGKYILATPTDGANTNENSGIWFLELTTTLSMNFNNLQPLSNGFHYEGWAILNGKAISTGNFNVDTTGNIIDLEGKMIPNGEFVIYRDLSGSSAIVITIEPNNDPDPLPADTHYLSGDVSNNQAALTVGHTAAFGDDFMTAAGKYLLATPTDTVSTDENSGIWFLDLSSGSSAQGLTLPTLPAGWEFEGWVVFNGVPVTTGKFTNPIAADKSAPFSGSLSGPSFPGEDFLQNAPDGLTFPTDLAGATAVISVEPSPDDDVAPFTLKPLVGMIPGDATDHITYDMGNNSSGFPTGSANLTVNVAPGLHLATLPTGWAYEGWVVISGMPVTTGRFTNPASADDNAPFSGTEAGPSFPGEDFLQNAPVGLTFPTDIAGRTAVISIEPSPDDDEKPFTLKPLVGMIPGDATDHVTYMQDNKAADFPMGTATLETTTSVETRLETSGVPSEFSLMQNYPNPFNPQTEIHFNLKRTGFTLLKIYNYTGQEVTTLINKNLDAGFYEITFNAINLPSGTYFYRLESNGLSQVRKMILLK